MQTTGGRFVSFWSICRPSRSRYGTESGLRRWSWQVMSRPDGSLWRVWMRRKEVRVVSAIREKIKSVKKITVLICGVWAMWSACFTSCATGEKTQGISAEAQRRFDYYYAEAVKSKLAGRYDDSFELYKHCLDIKPDAAEALYNLGLYYLGMDDSARCASHLSRAVALEPDNIYYKEALRLFDFAQPGLM